MQRSHHDLGKMDLPPEQHISLLDRNWKILKKTHTERHALIEDEVTRMERLQRLADKVHAVLRQGQVLNGDVQMKRLAWDV